MNLHMLNLILRELYVQAEYPVTQLWSSLTCYQLVQFILKIGSVPPEREEHGEVGGYHSTGDSTWQRVVAGCRKTRCRMVHLSAFLHKWVNLLLCKDSISGI